jgi:hypothetical protein
MTAAPRPPSAFDRPLSRSGCLLGGLLWLAVMALPLAALWLAARGEVTWRRGEFTEDRLWLVNESGAQGLGWSSARVASDQRPVDGPVCVRTQVRFLLWKGTSENLAFCECYVVSRAAGGLEAFGSCP